jgi:hypothetical protein
MNNQKLNIKQFEISQLNNQLVIIPKRDTGKSWIRTKDRFDIEYELRLGKSHTRLYM